MQQANNQHVQFTKGHALIGRAKAIPVNAPQAVVTVCPVILSVPGRHVALEMRVSAPVSGDHLPIIVFSHGQGRSNHLSSMNGYAPLAEFWASHGFVVIQPTHLSSKSLSLDPSLPGAPMFWKSRMEDLKEIIDRLTEIEDLAPIIKGRLDCDKIAVAGHSAGGATAGGLLGTQFKDSEEAAYTNMFDARVKAGVLLAAPGSGGDDLSSYAYSLAPHLRYPHFATMKTPALVVVGEYDVNPRMSRRGADWHADPYHLSPVSMKLLSLDKAGHILGGISGYDANETDDEDPERVACVQRMTWAYLQSALYPENKAWADACAAFVGLKELGSVESK